MSVPNELDSALKPSLGLLAAEDWRRLIQCRRHLPTHVAARKIKTHSSHSSTSLGATPGPVSPAHENGNGNAHGASAARAFSAGPSLSSANSSHGTDDSRDMMALARKYASPTSQNGGGGGGSVSTTTSSKPARSIVSRRAPTTDASPSTNQHKHAAAVADHLHAAADASQSQLHAAARGPDQSCAPWAIRRASLLEASLSARAR